MNCRSSRCLSNGDEIKKSTGYKRTFTGCWRCRERKVKCDRLRPSCSPCRKGGLHCSGYQQNLVWVSADQKTYRHNGRRFLEPYQTWQDQPVLSSLQLDDLIRNCDVDGKDVNDQISCPPFSAFRVASDPYWRRTESILDYCGAFGGPGVPSPLPDHRSPSQSSLGFRGDDSPAISTQDMAPPSSTSQYHTADSQSSTDSLQLSIPPTIRAENRLSQANASLFNVYLNAVAPTLVPVHEARNPWLRYPAIALHLSFQEGKNHLLHALMAQAAFCLGHQGLNQEAMSAMGTRLYSSAMAELRACIREKSTDYVGLLTTILTFLLLELSRGSSKAWRCHLQAAWKFLNHHRDSKSWTSSPDAWYVTQSFHLLKTGSDSCGFVSNDTSDAESPTTSGDNRSLAQEVMCNPGYGWTLGSSSSVMETIASINTIAARLEQDDTDESTATISLRLNQTLLKYQREVLAKADLATESPNSLKRDPQYLHLQAFQAAVLIYYYQVCDQLSPRQLSYLVSAVFTFLSAFFEICGGSFTLWPVFVAAAEAYEEDDQVKFLTLLENVGTAGMRNMSNYKTLLKQIWNARAVRAAIEDRAIADTRVDWREVMRELDMDVLIL